MKLIKLNRARTTALLIAITVTARADIIVPGANGMDGVFHPTVSTNIDLRKARALPWTSDQNTGGDGVYDAEKWAVVFRYESVRIPANVSVTFQNHDSRAPVVWLVSGDVIIEPGAVISLNGSGYGDGIYSPPGPGGFRGGRGMVLGFEGSGGFGIGGGSYAPGAIVQAGPARGGHSTASGAQAAAYGDAALRVLVGGSGGGAVQMDQYPGAGGGGALLIASQGEARIDGIIQANGGRGRASWDSFLGSAAGGAIRIVAERLAGNGTIQAIGGWGASTGRIRVEAASFANPLIWVPEPSMQVISGAAEIFPPMPSTARILTVREIASPFDPKAEIGIPPGDISLPGPGAATVLIETLNFEPGTGRVTLYLIPARGQRSAIPATLKPGGNFARAEWEATVTLAPGSYAMQAHAKGAE